MSKQLLEIRNVFRNLCGALSVEEIFQNPELINSIERIENLFCSEQEVLQGTDK
jgi:hypothetical protein